MEPDSNCRWRGSAEFTGAMVADQALNQPGPEGQHSLWPPGGVATGRRLTDLGVVAIRNGAPIGIGKSRLPTLQLAPA